MLSRNVFTQVSLTELAVMKQQFKKCQRVLNIFIVLCFGVVLFYAVFPAIDQGQPGQKNYPFPGEFPFNPDDYYMWVYCGQILTVASSAWTNSAIDCLFQKHVTMATVFFQILCGRFRNVMDKLDENNEEILRRIKKCVIYYNATIEYVSMIQNTFSYGILIQFLCSVIIICLTVFQLSLVVDYNSTKFVLMIIYLLCMMFQVSLYCWYGHILMEKSNEITAACYAINWNDLNLVNQKLLIIIMERAKRPVELNALGVFKLNLSTMVTVRTRDYREMSKM
ncbi:hypothetical protein GWI33_022493 [Rhynchophorus ferrugineus]|uniref:Odorant receptor n=1 Tax=Rhynchophorus ferrugineus TaxID=354439 RepID=A0A834IQL6_RHYFE|nr:hypothetical protein GWI33_022493 [Rhynchophorus ferrugineus]